MCKEVSTSSRRTLEACCWGTITVSLSTHQPVFYTQHVSQTDYESLLNMKAGPEKDRFDEADWDAWGFHQSRTVTLAMVLLTCDQLNALTRKCSEVYLGACVQT